MKGNQSRNTSFGYYVGIVATILCQKDTWINDTIQDWNGTGQTYVVPAVSPLETIIWLKWRKVSIEKENCFSVRSLKMVLWTKPTWSNFLKWKK